MPWGLKRFQEAKCLHFITFSCHNRERLLGTPDARDVFERTLEQVRGWYDFYVCGYVVMPEHVHLLISEPERSRLSTVLKMLKQNVARELRLSEGNPFWQESYYDFNVWSEGKRVEKIRYIHRNPVRRGLVERPEDWKWSSFLHYATGVDGVVEIESKWTAQKRERMGIVPAVRKPQTKVKVPALSHQKAVRQGRGTLELIRTERNNLSCSAA
jgi:putative transposase